MSRIIDADALKITLGISAEYCDKCRWGDIRGRCSRSGDFEIVCCAIDEAPTIDPVKHGRWELAEDGWYCSACELYPPFDCDPEEKGVLFCPWCGAKMDEDELRQNERRNESDV